MYYVAPASGGFWPSPIYKHKFYDLDVVEKPNFVKLFALPEAKE